MANFYKQYVKLLDKWPVDKSKSNDLGQYIRDQIKIEFKKGEHTKIEDKEKCQRYYESLNRLASNHYSNKYPVQFKKTATGLTPEECRYAVSKEFQEELVEQKTGFFDRIVKKVKNTIARYSDPPKQSSSS